MNAELVERMKRGELVVAPAVAAARRAVCEACPSGLYAAGLRACAHPQCGCPAGQDKFEPWGKMARCPGGYWEGERF